MTSEALVPVESPSVRPDSLADIFSAVTGGSTNMVRVATRLAAIGVPVFPMIEVDGQIKQGVIKRRTGEAKEYFTLHDASREPSVIERMFARPGAGVAAMWEACGLVVVDIDWHKRERDGATSFGELVGHDPRLDPTRVITRRGLHILRRIPDGDYRWRSGVAPGIDVLGSSLVATPRRWNRSYDWTQAPPSSLTGPIPELWGPLADLLREAPPKPPKPYQPKAPRVPHSSGWYDFDEINRLANRDSFGMLLGVGVPERGNFPCPLKGHSHNGEPRRGAGREASLFETPDDHVLLFRCYGQHESLGSMGFLQTANAAQGVPTSDVEALKAAAEEWGFVVGAKRTVPSPVPPPVEVPINTSSDQPPSAETALTSGGTVGEGEWQNLADGEDESHLWPEVPDAFWSRHEVYGDIRDGAIAHTVAPSAALGAVLAVRSAQMPPDLQLKPFIDVRSEIEAERLGMKHGASLALFSALISAPRTGKLLATQFAINRMKGFPVMDRFPVQRTPSSGEGLLSVFLHQQMRPNRLSSDPPSNVVVVFDEAGLLQQITDRRGSTLKEWLKSAYSNVALRTDAGNLQFSRSVDPSEYSLGVIVGTTIPQAGFLLDVSTGFGSRFLAFPVVDRGLSQTSYDDWERLSRSYVEASLSREPADALQLPGDLQLRPSRRVAERIHNMHVIRYNGGGSPGLVGDPLVWHKLAGLLGSLKAQWEGRPWVGARLADWEDAGVLVDYCTSVLGVVERLSQAHDMGEAAKRGRRLGQEDSARRRQRDQNKQFLYRAAATIGRRVWASDSGAMRSELSSAPSGKHTRVLRHVYGGEWVGLSLQTAEEYNWIARQPGPGGRGTRYVRGEVEPPPPLKPGRPRKNPPGGETLPINFD